MLLIRDRLLAHKEELIKELWAVVDGGDKKDGARFRALAALAGFDPKKPSLAQAGKDVVGPLLAVEALHVGVWSKGLREVRDSLMEPLGAAFRDGQRPVEGHVAAGVLRDYAAEQPETLAELLMDADVQQFPMLLPCLRVHADRAVPLLHEELDAGLRPLRRQRAAMPAPGARPMPPRRRCN